MTQKPTRHLVSRRALLALAALFVVTSAVPASAVTIPTVPVGNLGNATDPLTGSLYGSVSYAYNVGTTEVTNAQYAAFLNAKAAADPLGLYNTSMGSDARGGISRSGVSGSFTYTTKTNMGDKPVNYVSWYDSIRFANWLNNGQGTGDTETGAYTLLGGTATPSNGLSITRNVGATWFLTSEDEWYKAAYYQPAAQGGDSDNYWLYPTASNSVPAIATANSVGDISNPGANVANYLSGADWNSQDGNVTTVAGAGSSSESYFGTSDQGGNVWEWNEARIGTSARGLRGGAWSNNTSSVLAASFRASLNPTIEDSSYGFRVATVPEPNTIVLALCGALSLLAVAHARARGAAVIGGVLLASATSAHAASFTFQGLGDLAGGETWSIAAGVSADGMVVVGSSGSTNGREAVRWTSGGGLVGLGDLPGGAYSSRGAAISGDGNVITGWSASGTGRQVIRWTQATGMVGLGDVPGGTMDGFGQGINFDGSVIVGQGESASGTEAFRWSDGGGIQAILVAPTPGSAFGTNDSGSLTAGQITYIDNSKGAILWESNVGSFQPPSVLFGGDAVLRAVRGTTHLDAVAVGSSDTIFGVQAIRWTSGSPISVLGDLVGGTVDSEALALSSDGAVIVGRGTSAVGSEAFLWWNSLVGMVNLRDYLIAHGAGGLSNWTLTAATGISADGHTIVGYGTNPDGFTEAWIATVPEPSTLLLAGCGAVGLLFLAIRGKSGSNLEKWLTSSTTIRRFLSRRLVVGSFCPLFIAALAARPVDGAYVFTNVADTTNAAPTFIGFPLPGPAVSENRAAFSGLGSATGIYTGSGGPLTKIVKTGDAAPIGTIGGFGTPAISGSTAAFRGNYQAGTGIFTGSGGSLTAIAKTGDAAPVGSFDGFNNPAIHDSTAAFRATYDSGAGQGIFAGNGGLLTTVAKSGDAAPVGTFGGFDYTVAISGSATAFSGSYSDGVTNGSGIFVGNGGPLTTIAKTGDAAPVGTFGGFGPPSLSGTIAAFSGSYSDGVTTGSGIFTGSGGPLTTIVKSGDAAPVGTFDDNSFLFAPSGGSTVAFLGRYNGGANQAIFTGSGGALNYVIGDGDSLFGSTVLPNSLFLGPYGADEGSLAFKYALADGRSGIAIATVPEPSTMVLAACGVVGLMLLRGPGRRLSRCTWRIACLLVCGWLSLFVLPTAQAIMIPTVPVGNAGNAGDVQSQGTFGAVAYDYRIGTTEVTVGQYTSFLNAVAATDTYALYNPLMAVVLDIAGISRSGASGSYTYSVIGSPNKPVTFVSWGDAARFANWLHNGQPTGAQNASTTEDGAYTLNGATNSFVLNAVSRNANAVWFIPSEDEWYKAAYHQNDGVTGNYWDYPTASDSAPFSDQPPGSDAPTQSNTGNFNIDDGIANLYNDGWAVTGSTSFSSSQNYLTDVGSYFLSTSAYGTYDQGGNVWEWNEALVGIKRGVRGGVFGADSSLAKSSFRGGYSASSDGDGYGFRVATVAAVPEPSSIALAAFGFSALFFWGMRHRT